MKLRIKGDSLRLRVTRAELARLLNGERIEDSIHFSSAPDVHLTYALRSAEQSIPVRIECVPQAIVVLISKEQLRFWSNDSEVGIYGSIELGRGSSLEVLIENDFACLDRSDEENTDHLQTQMRERCANDRSRVSDRANRGAYSVFAFTQSRKWRKDGDTSFQFCRLTVRASSDRFFWPRHRLFHMGWAVLVQSS